MDPERWRRVEEIYYGALELEPARRNENVDHACGGDAALRDEVGRLLDDEAEAESFIESPAVEVAARALIGGTPDVPVATAGKPSGEEVPAPLTAYAALRRRLSDIRLMIRQWVQYAAARGALPSLVPLVAIVFAVDLLLHRSQPLGEILKQRGLLYGALVAAGILLHWNRRKWPAAPDRRFFREHYSAQHLLHAVIDEIRAAQSLAKVAPRVVLQIEGALHPESAAVLVRRPAESEFGLLAGGGGILESIASDHRLITLLRMLEKPMEISRKRGGWPWNHLSREESLFLRKARVEWIFPICLAADRTEAILVLGPKRSGSPYSEEDQELLQGIASGLALLLERSPAIRAEGDGLKECPECGLCYDAASDRCSEEGAALTPLPYSRLLSRRYRFEKRLEKGGMGVVYQALDLDLERPVAIKLVHPSLASFGEAAERFRREARAAAGFTHPNVVTIHDYGVSEDGRAFLVMELLKGTTLRRELMMRPRMSPSRAANVLSGVCAAVDAAHGRRLLHRDLKPENIFLTRTGDAEVAKIFDFGVAKSLVQPPEGGVSDRTEPGRLVGTLKYMSPEELQGEKPAESWDLWAVAVVAYEMLAGAHPFAGSTLSEVRNAILDGRMAPIRKHLAEVPPAWQQFFDKALAFCPASRPQSALQLLSEFKRAIA